MAAERCVNVLLELIGTRVSYVVQEAVVVMKVSCLLSLLKVTLLTVLPFFPGHFPKVPIDLRRSYSHIMF